MDKKWIALVGLLVATGIAVFLWKGGSNSDSATKAKAPVAEAPKVVRMTSTPTDLRAAGADTLVADDRIGNLRLEGQVVDETQDGVAGAVVSISSNPRRTVVSAEDGSFHFDQLVGRTYSLVASSESGAAGPVSAQLSDKSDPIILHLRGAAAIEVTVLKASDRSPLANATVELRGLMSRSSSSDGNGVARFVGVAPGFYRVAASAPGYALSQVPRRIGGGGATFEAELLLKEGSQVSGIVRNTEGKPVAEAQVLYSSASDRFSRANPRFDAQVTDAEGRFSFAALPTGTFRFTARHETYAPGQSEPVTLSADTATDNVEITVEAGAVLAGRVIDEDGNPAALAAVRVSVESRGRRGSGRPRQVYSDEDGVFEMTGLARKPVTAVALHESATSETYSADLSETPEKRDVELILGLTGVIAGNVSSSNGEPVDGAQIRLLPNFRDAKFSFAEMRLRGMTTGVSDAGGHFEFGGLAEGATFSVVASPPGSAMQFRGPRGRGSDLGIKATVGDTDVRVVLEARGAIVGKVAFADGSTPSAFTITMGGFRGRATPFSTKDGSFRIGDLEPGTYEPRVSGADFEQSPGPEVEIESGVDVDVGTITVIAGRKLSGRVLGSSGQAVANATVTAGARLRGSGASASGGGFRGRGGGNKTATTDENGDFVIRGVSAGALVVAAEHETEGRSAPLALPTSSESTEGLQLQLLAPGAMEGTVTLDGSPADSARITVQSQDVPSATFAVSTGADGKYRFDVLAPGSYLVSVQVGNPRTGVAATSKSVVLEAESVAQVDLVMTLGKVTLQVSAEAEGLDFATVEVVEGELSASTAKELETVLATETSGASSFVVLFGGQPAAVKNLKPGSYTVCITPFPEGVVGRESRPYLDREGERLPVFCKQTTVAATPEEQQLVVPVIVPDFVPDGTAPAPGGSE